MRSTKGSMNPPPWDGSFVVHDTSVIDSLSQCVKNPKQCVEIKWEFKCKKTIMVTMIMIMVKNEWKTLPIYNKVLG